MIRARLDRLCGRPSMPRCALCSRGKVVRTRGMAAVAGGAALILAIGGPAWAAVTDNLVPTSNYGAVDADRLDPGYLANPVRKPIDRLSTLPGLGYRESMPGNRSSAAAIRARSASAAASRSLTCVTTVSGAFARNPSLANLARH